MRRQSHLHRERAQPYWITAKLLTSGFDGHANEIEDDIDMGAVKQETVIENVEGDVYLVRDFYLDWGMVMKAGTKHEE